MGQRRSHYPSQLSLQRKLKRYGAMILGILACVLLLSSTWIINQVQDFMILQEPRPDEITRLAQATHMTPEAQRLFYRQDPNIISKEELAQQCPIRHLSGAPLLPELQSLDAKDSNTKNYQVTLGCYITQGTRDRFGNLLRQSGRIYIQKILDPRFAGLMESTAAHEMLHAAYERLNFFDRYRLGPQLEHAASRVQDPNLKQILKQYAATDHALYLNELHSHLGVELENLGEPELEQHYQRYFVDRQKVVNLVKQSQVAVNQMDTRSKSLEQEINQLETSLKQEKEILDRADQDLDDQKRNLDQLRDTLSALSSNPSSSLTTQIRDFEALRSQFNAQVPVYNAQVEANQANITAFNEKVALYREKVKTYNSLVKEKRSLIEGLSTETRKPE